MSHERRLSIPSDEYRFISGGKTDHLYKHEWGNRKGCFIVVMFDSDENPTEMTLPIAETATTRTKITIGFKYSSKDLTEITLKKFRKAGNGEWNPEPNEYTHGDSIKFQPIDFARLRSILETLITLDIKSIESRRLKITAGNSRLDSDTASNIRTALMREGGDEFIANLLRDGAITDRDIVNLGYRKTQLSIFRNIIHDREALFNWADQNSISKHSEEGIWQKFFERNTWIFGYGLDYKFNYLLQREADIGHSDFSGSDSPISDFLLSDSRFVTLVEIKLPGSKIFRDRKNRAGTWSLHTELTESISQVITQKSEIIANYANKSAYLEDGSLMIEDIADPKTFLIYGRWPEEAKGSDKNAGIQRRTFELFRRNLRNVEVITYDELLDRAEFIVEHAS